MILILNEFAIMQLELNAISLNSNSIELWLLNIFKRNWVHHFFKNLIYIFGYIHSQQKKAGPNVTQAGCLKPPCEKWQTEAARAKRVLFNISRVTSVLLLSLSRFFGQVETGEWSMVGRACIRRSPEKRS